MNRCQSWTTKSACAWALLAMLAAGCAPIRVPALDPSGRQIFLPPSQSTTIVTPGSQTPLLPGLPTPAFQTPPTPPPCPPVLGPTPIAPLTGPVVPAQPIAATSTPPTTVPAVRPGPLNPAQAGAIVLSTPKIIAPVGSEVVVLAGLCGSDGYFVKRQPLEWTLSQESVGQLVQVSDPNLPGIASLFRGPTGKFSTNYAKGRSSSQAVRITRGTPTPVDDFMVQEGQAWISVSSPSEGTSYVTCFAPEAEGWDRRRQTAVIHWVDATANLPPAAVVRSATVHTLTTSVQRTSTGQPVEGWLVRYEVLPGSVPAEFLPAAAAKAEAITDANGQVSVQIRQPANQVGPGVTQVRVEVVRTGMRDGQPTKLSVASGITTIRWSAPALTIRATGPPAVGKDNPFTYRVHITNPGDMPARDAVLEIKQLPPELQFVSSQPQATQFGDRLQWRLGDIAPGSAPVTIDVQLKGIRQGNPETCFDLTSAADQLQTRACVQTRVAVPCIGMTISGPREARVGDEVNYQIEVKNQCQETLKNITLIDNFDAGLQAPGRTSPMQYGPFDLEPGQVEKIELTFIVRQPGTRCHRLTVTADGGHTAEAQSCFNAIQVDKPAISVEMTGPPQAQVGAAALVRVVVNNTGNIPLTNVAVTGRFSPSLEPTRATQGYVWRDGALVWTVASLGAGQSQTFEVIYACKAADPQATSSVQVGSDQGITASDQHTLQVLQVAQPNPGAQPGGGGQASQPSPADQPGTRVPNPVRSNTLKVSITDLNDPINQGEDVTYLVQITNDRNESDRNVAATLFVPDGMQYLGGGPDDDLVVQQQTDGGRQIVMTPRRELRAGESLNLRVRLQSLRAGQFEFRVGVASELARNGVQDSEQTLVNP